MKHPDRITVQSRIRPGSRGCDCPVMGALLLVLLAVLTFVRIVL